MSKQSTNEKKILKKMVRKEFQLNSHEKIVGDGRNERECRFSEMERTNLNITVF